MTKITAAFVLCLCALLGACGGGDEAGADLGDEVDVAVCSMPADQSAIRSRCGALIDPQRFASFSVQFVGTVVFDASAARSFSVSINGAESAVVVVSGEASTYAAFRVEREFSAADLAGAQVAEIGFNSSGQASKLQGVTRIITKRH